MLIEVKNLKKYFPIKGSKEVVKAVDEVSFGIEKGKTFGLVGESGCGKSTTARTIIRLHEATSGSVVFDSFDTSKMTKSSYREFSKNIQMVFQDPYASLNPRMTVERTLMDPLNIHKIGTKQERQDRVKELLELVGLDLRYLKRYPHEFSGGQRQRIGIARALALNPQFVILDEAVSALDVSIQSQILNLLMDLQQKLKLTYLFISHDLSVIEYMCDNIGIMYLGKIVESGDRNQIFNNPSHPYTKALLSAIPEINPDKRREQIILKGDLPSITSLKQGCAFYSRCNASKVECEVNSQDLQMINDGHFVACQVMVDDIKARRT